MKITIGRSDAAAMMGRVKNLAGRKTSLAITDTVLIRAADGRVTFAATDLETWFEGACPATVAADGRVALPAKKLAEITGAFPDAAIEIEELSDQWVRVVEWAGEKAAASVLSYHLAGMDPDEFPPMPEVDPGVVVSVDAGRLRWMIDRAVVVSAKEPERRPHIRGALVTGGLLHASGGMRMVSTDNCRLTVADELEEAGADAASALCPDGTGGALVPKRALADIGRFVEGAGSVRIGVSGSYLVVSGDTERMAVSLLQGEFPSYDGNLEADPAHDLVLDRARFSDILRRALILTSDNYRAVFLRLDPPDGQYADEGAAGVMTVSNNNPAMGSFRESFPVHIAEPGSQVSESVELAVNPRYMLDAAGLVGGKQVVFNIRGPKHPCILRADPPDGYIALVKPMAI